jgi:hypothetical protein
MPLHLPIASARRPDVDEERHDHLAHLLLEVALKGDGSGRRPPTAHRLLDPAAVGEAAEESIARSAEFCAVIR